MHRATLMCATLICVGGMLAAPMMADEPQFIVEPLTGEPLAVIVWNEVVNEYVLTSPWWTVELIDRPRKVGITPDLDGDGLRDIRLGFRFAQGWELRTEIRSSLDGTLLYLIHGQKPFDPWMEVAGDFDGDGAVDWRDLVEAALRDDAGALAEARMHLGDNLWHEFNGGSAPMPPTTTGVARRTNDRKDEDGIVEPQGSSFSVQVRTVTFGGSAHDVYKDNPPSAWYLKRWHDQNGNGSALDFAQGDSRDPLCYTINASVQVASITLKVTAGTVPNLTNATIVGKVDGVDVFTGSNLSVQTPSPGVTFINSSTFTGSLTAPATIALWDERQIQWRLVTQVVPGVEQAGNTQHDFHFVLLDPPNGAWKLHYSYIHIGCTAAAGLGVGDDAEIITDIWVEFADREVFRAQDQLESPGTAVPLKYYGAWLTENITAEALLDDGDGQCGAWTLFFIRTLHAVGITATSTPTYWVKLRYKIPIYLRAGLVRDRCPKSGRLYGVSRLQPH